MNTQAALILFIKAPILGNCKTRIANEIGEEVALDIYTDLIEHTLSSAADLSIRKIVFIDQPHPITTSFKEKGFEVKIQEGEDLGLRMFNAFQSTFNEGADYVTIIGSDCPELVKEDIEKAFSKLHHNDAIIGPAKDGGYYLLGLKKIIPSLFKDIPWSTAEVLNTSISRLKREHKSFYLLSEKTDIDQVEDLAQFPQFAANASL